MAEKNYTKNWIKALRRFYAMYFFSWVIVFVMALFPIEEGSYPDSSDSMSHVIITIMAILLILVINAIIFTNRIDKVRSMNILEERVYKFGLYNVYKFALSCIPIYISIIYLKKTPVTLIILLTVLLALYTLQFPTKTKILEQLNMTESELEKTLKERQNTTVTKK